MPARLVALDEGVDIPLDRSMVVVGRHPQCDARLDSLRISRHHCCMTQDHGEVIVRDLGSTNGIRINGQRVELGRLRPGDELSIAHIRYRLDNGQGHEPTVADAQFDREREQVSSGVNGAAFDSPNLLVQQTNGMPAVDNLRIAAVVRERLGDLADQCRIQVIVQMPNLGNAADGGSSSGGGSGSDPAGALVPAAEKLEACQPDSSP